MWLLPLFVVRPEPPPPGAFRLTVLDVGQGLAVVVETHRHTLVYDTGPRFSETADAGGRIVAPFLRAAGLRRADGLIVSHQDLDHSGGALSLMQATPVGWFASSLPADHPIVVRAQARANADNERSWRASPGSAGLGRRATSPCCIPTRAEYDDPQAKTNDRSCVVRIDSAYGSALLTGDIEAQVRGAAAAHRRRRAARRRAGRAASRFAHVVHAGIHSQRSRRRIAVFACGYRNRFGHPRPDIVARYEAASVRMIRTDLDGAVTLTFAPDTSLVPISARDQRRRYWMDVPEVLPAMEDEPLPQ